MAYGLFVLYMTMVYREPADHRGRLELFYSYKRMLSNDGIRQQIVNNILLFVSLGAGLCSLLSNRYSPVMSMFLSVAVCIALSVAIETVQWFFAIGMAEADDVVSNGLGGLIGAVIGGLWPMRSWSSRNNEKL